MRARMLLVLLLALVAPAFLFPGCGAGGGTTNTDATDNAPADPNDDQPPGDPQLEQDFAQILQQNNINAVQPIPPAPQALVTLGRALFFDKILSGNRNISCSTCHEPTAGTGDALSVSIGEGGTGSAASRQLGTGVLIPRNAPPVFNRGLPSERRMFWDSRVSRAPNGNLNTPEPALNGGNPTAADIAAQLDTALAAQAMFPVTSREEMRGQAGENEIADAADNLEVWALLMERLVGTNNGSEGGIEEYRDLFQAAFPNVVDFDDFNFGHAARALGAYQATAFQALDSPFDRYLAGDTNAVSDDAKRGALLFYGRANCDACHEGPLMSDNQHHAIAVPQVGPGKDFPGEDTGRALVTGDQDDVYRFRTPSLRNVEITGPWMHDGAYATLENAIRHYDNPTQRLQNYNANQLAPLVRGLVDLDPGRNQARADALSGILRPAPNLNGQDIDLIAAFLRSLTDPVSTDLSSEVPPRVPSGLPVGD